MGWGSTTKGLTKPRLLLGATVFVLLAASAVAWVVGFGLSLPFPGTSRRHCAIPRSRSQSRVFMASVQVLVRADRSICQATYDWFTTIRRRSYPELIDGPRCTHFYPREEYMKWECRRRWGVELMKRRSPALYQIADDAMDRSKRRSPWRAKPGNQRDNARRRSV